ncbi:hypothetical protein E2562_001319 [Oryza meyeriana var. granulata]|uniref:Zinc finger GRF-type domain-containing protein n=1 Tax=Oryza meyeriana var. granulata TaxID=110450 RepID=A0A6G1DED3_9ORYZ|nr:hypothetical protein E2562_001319 [Oryza meyeriana var. granulata]
MRAATQYAKVEASIANSPEVDCRLNDKIPPIYVEDYKCFGVESNTDGKQHETHMPPWVEASEKSGLRWYRCRKKVKNECNFVKWVDGERPDRMKRTIDQLWKDEVRAETMKARIIIVAKQRIEALESNRKLQLEKMAMVVQGKKGMLMLL